MPYIKYKSIAQVTTQLALLENHIQLIYERLGYPKDPDTRRLMDVRPYGLGTMQSETAINVMILNVLVAVKDGVIPAEKFRSIIGVSDQTISLEHIEYYISSYLRLAYVTMLQFRIENMITNILAVLDKTKLKNRAFHAKARALLDLLGLEDKERQLDKLMVLQHIRNGLHSNGIHNNSDFSITIDDYPFIFEKGKPINCAGWEHIVIAFESALTVIEKILGAPQVRAITEPISTAYIEQS